MKHSIVILAILQLLYCESDPNSDKRRKTNKYKIAAIVGHNSEANPDVKSAVDAGTIPTGYQHWYSYASTNETTRKTKQAYVDAKAAIDAGFNEKAYRMAHTDIDNLVKNNTNNEGFCLNLKANVDFIMSYSVYLYKIFTETY